MIAAHGPPQGYYSNATDSLLIVKPEQFDQTKEMFRHRDINIKASGEIHQRAVLGTTAAKEKY